MLKYSIYSWHFFFVPERLINIPEIPLIEKQQFRLLFNFVVCFVGGPPQTRGTALRYTKGSKTKRENNFRI